MASCYLFVCGQKNMYCGCKTQGDSVGYKSSTALVQLKAERAHTLQQFSSTVINSLQSQNT